MNWGIIGQLSNNYTYTIAIAGAVWLQGDNLMAVQRKMMGEILTELGIITNKQLAAALDEQKQSREKLGTILVNRGL